MHSAAAGFYNAPLLKIITFSTGIFTLFPYTFIKKHLELQGLDSIVNYEVWRLVTNNLFFPSVWEGVVGVYLLYHFRIFERQMGTAKFAAFLTSTFGISTSCILALFVLFNPKGTATGPYPLLFALLVQYYHEVPATYRFRFLGVNGSNKIWIYGIACQLLLSRHGLNPIAVALALSGLISGVVYRNDIFPFKRFSLPQFLLQFCTKYIYPFVQSPPGPPTANRNANMNLRAPPRPVPAVAAPSESDVTALMDLGFPREVVLGALRNANNDPQLAATLLLDPI